jgi:hypothetical protein
MKTALKNSDKLLITPVSMTNSATQSASWDTIGADYATIRIAFSSAINTNAVGPTVSLLSSDDTVVTNHATIVANRVETITNAHETVYHVDLKTAKRYLRLTVTTATATNDNVVVSATGTLSMKEEAPSNTASMVASTNDAVVIV